MSKFNGKRTPSPDQGAADNERRRLGKIVHDERGSASVEWHDAPDDYERPVLEIEGTGARPKLDILTIKNDDTFNPYDRSPEPSRGPARAPAVPHTPPGGKRDLKKLSAWIKLMRELEERKKNGGSEE